MNVQWSGNPQVRPNHWDILDYNDGWQVFSELPIDCSQIMIMIALRGNLEFGHSHCPLWHCSQGTLSNSHQSPTTLSPMTSCPLPLGVSAPFPADLFQNVSFSSRLCCLFYRSLSLCCERLRLLVMEVNLTNLWISPISFGLLFFPFFLHILFLFSVPRSISPPVHCFVFTYLQEQCLLMDTTN